MAVNQAYITVIEPTFGAIDAARATALIEIAQLEIFPAKWGNQVDLATAYLVLHNWTIQKNKGRGSVTQTQLGDMSTQYGSLNGQKDADAYDLTSWGSQYKRLKRMQFTGPLVTGG